MVTITLCLERRIDMKTKKYRISFESYTRAEKLKGILDDLDIEYKYYVFGRTYSYNFETTKNNFKEICKAFAIDKEDLIISYAE